MARLGAGDAAPSFELAAAVSGRPTGLPHDAGRVLVLIFHAPDQTDRVEPVNAAIREARYEAAQVLVANILDVSGLPRAVHGAVRQIVEQAYTTATDAMPDTVDAAEYVVVLLDWDGAVTRRYGATGRPTVVVVDRDGDIATFQRDDAFAPAVLEILPYIVAPEAS